MQATNPLPLFPVGQSKHFIEGKNYDRSPDLSPEERMVLAQIAQRLKQGKQAERLLSILSLRRLMLPLLDLCALPQKKQKSVYQQVLPFLIEMHQRNSYTEA